MGRPTEDKLLEFLRHVTARARGDVYATYAPYDPPPPIGKKQGAYHPQRSPLTEDVVRRHLTGEQPIGVYLLDPAAPGATRLAVVDIDDKNREHGLDALVGFARRVEALLAPLGLLPWPCVSGSGHGVHLWLLWEAPQDAAQVRALLKELVTKADLPVHVDIFPGNVVKDPQGLGTLVALPLARGSRPLDLATGQVVDLSAWQPASPPLSAPVRAPGSAPGARDGKTRGTYGRVDKATLADALRCVKPDVYETWRDVGLAVKRAVADEQLSEEEGWETWLAWSKTSPSYDEREQVYQWGRFNPSGELTLGTVWHLAQQGGWTPPKQDNIPSADDLEKCITKLNERFFVAREGSKYFIFEEIFDREFKRHDLARLTKQDFYLAVSNQSLTTHDKQGRPRHQPVADLWYNAKNQRRFEGGVAFCPEPGGAPPDVYNLWRGFAVPPSDAGSCEKFKEHALGVICGGDTACYEYLMNWCALAVQRPHEPSGTAIILRGGQGTGKGTFARAFGRLFGQHFIHATNNKVVFSRFNSMLQDCVLLFLDEAYWAGAKSEQGTLKGLITEPTLLIEGKGRDAVIRKNMVHLLIATNNDWSVPADLDERRFLTLQVPGGKRNDRAYFESIWQELNAGGLAKLLGELQGRDIGDFNPTKIPMTPELWRQKRQTLGPVTEWWFHRLSEGTLSSAGDAWGAPVPVAVLYHDFVRYCELARYAEVGSTQRFCRKLEQLLPAAPVTHRERLRHAVITAKDPLPERSLQTYWTLASLVTCRARFTEISGEDLTWADLPQQREREEASAGGRDDEPLL